MLEHPTFGPGDDDVFCGDPGAPGYAACAHQMTIFAIASTIPAMLAMVLMVAAFATPAMRVDPELRTRTLTYAVMAWAIAGGTLLMGALPSL